MLTYIVPIILIVMFLASAIKVLNEYERAVVFDSAGSSQQKVPD